MKTLILFKIFLILAMTIIFLAVAIIVATMLLASAVFDWIEPKNSKPEVVPVTKNPTAFVTT